MTARHRLYARPSPLPPQLERKTLSNPIRDDKPYIDIISKFVTFD